MRFIILVVLILASYAMVTNLHMIEDKQEVLNVRLKQVQLDLDTFMGSHPAR